MSTPVELQRAKEQQLAATREALMGLVRAATTCTCQDHPTQGWSADCSAWLDRQAERVVDAILSSGVLRDADEVRRETELILTGHGVGEALFFDRLEQARTQLAELKAAIEALCEEAIRDWDAYAAEEGFDGSESGPDGKDIGVLIPDLRALLIDDGAAELREVKADVWDEAVCNCGTFDAGHPGDCAIFSRKNPYRDTAGDRCVRCGHEHDPADPGQCIIPASRLTARAVVHVDHPYTDPGDGRQECDVCGKWVWLVTHSCKGVPVTEAAMQRFRER